jgi:hypothetical protein
MDARHSPVEAKQTTSEDAFAMSLAAQSTGVVVMETMTVLNTLQQPY